MEATASWTRRLIGALTRDGLTEVLARLLAVEDIDAVDCGSTVTGPVIALSAACCWPGGSPAASRVAKLLVR